MHGITAENVGLGGGGQNVWACKGSRRFTPPPPSGTACGESKVCV